MAHFPPPQSSMPPPSPQWGKKLFNPTSDTIRWTGKPEEISNEKTKYLAISTLIGIATVGTAHLAYGAYKLGEHIVKELRQSDTRIYMKITNKGDNSVSFKPLGSFSVGDKDRVKMFNFYYEKGNYSGAVFHLDVILPTKGTPARAAFETKYPELMKNYQDAVVEAFKKSIGDKRYEQAVAHLDKVLPPQGSSDRVIFENKYPDVINNYYAASYKVSMEKGRYFDAAIYLQKIKPSLDSPEANPELKILRDNAKAEADKQLRQWESCVKNQRYGEAKLIAEKIIPKDPYDLEYFKSKNPIIINNYEFLNGQIDVKAREIASLINNLKKGIPADEGERQITRLHIMKLANQILPETKEGRIEFFNSPENTTSQKFWEQVNFINHDINMHREIEGKNRSDIPGVPPEVVAFWGPQYVQQPAGANEYHRSINDNFLGFDRAFSNGLIKAAYLEGDAIIIKLGQQKARELHPAFMDKFDKVQAEMAYREHLNRQLNTLHSRLQNAKDEMEKQGIRYAIINLPIPKGNGFRAENPAFMALRERVDGDYQLEFSRLGDGRIPAPWTY